MTIESTVLAILSDHFPGIDTIAPDMRLTEDLGASRLDKLEVTMDLEDYYRVSLTDKVNVVTKVITVRDLIELVGRFVHQQTGN